MKIAIVGMGLIGASIGRALIKNTSHEVYGYDSNAEVLVKATELLAHTRPLEVEDYDKLDLIIFALNPDIAIKEMKRICPFLKDGAIVADTCGNKRIICREMETIKKQYSALRFVGMHPMAGREYSGIDYSDANLFKNAYIILVPVGNDVIAVTALNKLWLEIGAKGIEICSAERHDEMIAYTSQLAHVVSNCYVQNSLSCKHAGFSAGSFADLTRVARLNPEMWAELFLENKDNLLSCIDNMSERLCEIREAIASDNEALLKEMLKHGTECKEIADNALAEKNNE